MEADRATIEVGPEVRVYLAAQRTLTLATASPTGVPHVTTLPYISDGTTLCFLLRPESVAARQVEQNSLVAFAIDRRTPSLREAMVLQGCGECREVRDAGEIEQAVALLGQKFGTSAAVRATDRAYYRIVPASLAFVDDEALSGKERPPGDAAHRDLTEGIFGDLPERAVTTITGQLDLAQIAAGEMIVRQGARAETFFIIVEGEVAVLRADHGQERTVATLTRGQFFGEMALLRGLPRSATVRATVPTTLLAMGRDAFRALVAQSLATAQDFDQVIQQRLGELGASDGR
jgi:nitroimidazol reductase NimA-like FMN-containing flavoprotein (pyridoxamine 5'-phosphate oxidase superfamily)